MRARRSARRERSQLLLGLILGMMLGAGLAAGILLARHTAVPRPPRQAPQAGTPRAPRHAPQAGTPRPLRHAPQAGTPRSPQQAPQAGTPRSPLHVPQTGVQQPPQAETSRLAPRIEKPAPAVGQTTPPEAHRPPAPAPIPAAVPPQHNPEASRLRAVVLPPETAGPPGKSRRHRVAIIFDDAGYGIKAAQEVEAIGRPLTISVLPHLPFSTQIAEEAPQHGMQVILHLPVQPDNPSIALGPGGITVDMADDEIRRTVNDDLGTVPSAVGANNHMGSLGTADPRVMRAVMDVMKTRHLFFVDSMTSSRSVAAKVAGEMGVPTAVRAVFLDNEDSEEYVRGQFRALIAIAQSRGDAIAIGHVGKVTARVLVSMLPEFDEAGIQLVRISDLVH